MAELESRLRMLGDELAWPETPDLADAVAARLAERGEARAPASGGAVRSGARRGGLRRRAVAIGAAVLVLVPAAGAAAFPGAREDVLEWLGLARTEVRRAPAPPVAPLPAEHDLGARVTLGEAVRRAGFRPLVPAALGSPDAVHAAQTGLTRRTTLLYRPRRGLPALDGIGAGLLVTQVEGELEGALVTKIIGAGTGARRVRVGSSPGVLFTGAPHVYLYLAPGGEVVEDKPFLAGNTLVLERDGAVIRLEAAAGGEALLRLAASLAP